MHNDNPNYYRELLSEEILITICETLATGNSVIVGCSRKGKIKLTASKTHHLEINKKVVG